MDKRQATPAGVGETPHAARTPAGSDSPETGEDGYELPPPPAPGALWATPSEASGSAPVSSPAAGSGRATVPGSAGASAPVSTGGSARPVSAVPGANAARASVPGAMRFDPSDVGAGTRPIGQAKIYGARVTPADEVSETEKEASDKGPSSQKRAVTDKSAEDWFAKAAAEAEAAADKAADEPDEPVKPSEPAKPAEPAEPTLDRKSVV